MPEQVHCANFEELAILYAAGELDEPVRTAVEAHAGQCAACAAVLEGEKRLGEAMAARDDVAEELDRSGLLLARCRSELSEALDDAAGAGRRGWRQLISPARWAAGFRRTLDLHPAWSTAVLLMAGAFAGLGARAWHDQWPLLQPGQPVLTISAAPRVSDQELETMGIEGIRWEQPEGTELPHVELQLRAQRPVIMQGSPDDSEIRRVLSYVLGHGQRFDPGVRLDSLELLRGHTADPGVRDALCQAAQRDPNPAVRLRSLEALRERGADPDVRQAMREALARDDNSGVRIEAVNGLFAALGAPQITAAGPDAETLGVLRDRMRNDPNQYVRSRSAAALAQLASASVTADSVPESIPGSPRP